MMNTEREEKRRKILNRAKELRINLEKEERSTSIDLHSLQQYYKFSPK